jgi:hypothetical protein
VGAIVPSHLRGRLSRMEQPPTFWESAWRYAKTSARRFWTVIVCTIIGDFVCFYLALWAWWNAPIPGGDSGFAIWLLVAAIIVVLAAIPVFSFHIRDVEHWKQRQDLWNQKTALEARIDAGLEVEAIENWDDTTRSLDVRLVVRNLSPLIADAVTVVIKSIDIAELANDKRQEATVIIDRLQGKRLMPRNRDSKESIPVLIPGHASKEFFFISATRETGVDVINELSPILLNQFGKEMIQGRLGTLPPGTYRICLVVSCRNRGAIHLLCNIVNRGASDLGFDFQELSKP